MTDKKTEHMERRKKHGLTYRDVAEEFGTSKSTAHRKIRKKNPNERAEEVEEDNDD